MVDPGAAPSSSVSRPRRGRGTHLVLLLPLFGAGACHAHDAAPGLTSSASASARAASAAELPPPVAPSWAAAGAASAPAAPALRPEPARRVTLSPEAEQAAHLVGCPKTGEPAVCAWWNTLLTEARQKAVAKGCAAGERADCLLQGLAELGQKHFEDAALHVGRACSSGEELACIFLAHTRSTCVHPAGSEGPLAQLPPACVPGFASTFDDRRAETTLMDDCKQGYGVACYFLGIGPWRQKDNKVPVLERGCRLGVMGACSALYDELSGLVPPPTATPNRLLITKLQMTQICESQPVDCLEVATDMTSITQVPARSYREKACDPRAPLHWPAEMCREPGSPRPTAGR